MAPRIASSAARSSSESGGGRRGCRMRGSKKLSGQSCASACTSWHNDKVTGPHSAGSSIVAKARGRAVSNCSGRGNPIEVAADRPEAVVRAHRPVPEVLHLLEHRVRGAVCEHVAREQQHGEPVHVGDGGRRHQVRGPGADGGGHRHRAAPVGGLGEGDRGVCHALLVVTAPGRHVVPDGVERLAEPGHVAVTEDGPHARDVRHARLDLLGRGGIAPGPAMRSASRCSWLASSRDGPGSSSSKEDIASSADCRAQALTSTREAGCASRDIRKSSNLRALRPILARPSPQTPLPRGEGL